nr:hypothetical protein [Tanacetum cinerariifolium]
MAILAEEGDGHIKDVVRVEYEWMPPHCIDCIRFGHDTSLCPKRVCLTTANPFDVLNGNGADMGESETQQNTSVGGGNQLEDEDSDFYDGYEDQVVDLHGALKEYRDFILSMSGKK